MPLLLSTPRIVQPAGAVRVNRGHPLTRGLVSLICPGCGLRDLVSGRVGASAGLRHALTSLGKSWSLDGTASTVIDLGGMPPGLPNLSGTYTLAAIVIPDGTSAVGPVIRLFDGTRNIQIGYVVNNGWMGMQSTVANSSRAVAVSSAYGKFHTFIGSHANGADIDTYVNGSSVGKASAMGASLTTAGYFLSNPEITATTAKVLLSAIWNRFLTVEEKQQFTRNPWALFESAGLWIDQPTGASAGLAGSATGQASASGTLTTGIPLSGAAVVQATGSGSLTTQIPIAGVAAAVASASGMLSLGISLSGAALVTTAASGQMQIVVALSGNAIAQAAATGALGVSSGLMLSGSAIVQASASGALSIAIPMSGAAQVHAGATGALTAGSAAALTGAAVTLAAALGALTVTVSLSGAAVAQAVAAGGILVQVPLSGPAVMHAVAMGFLTGGQPSVLAPRHALREYAAASTRRKYAAASTRRPSSINTGRSTWH